MTPVKTSSLTLTALMTAITCILGPFTIAVPISPVPVSFTNLAVYLSVILLGRKKGTLSCLLYLLLGLTGIPVFSAFTSGPARLLGPTGGYLIGFLFMAMVSGFFIDKFHNRLYMHILGMTLGTFICYAFGTLWLHIQADLSFLAALTIGVIPYLPIDAIKIILAAFLGNAVRKRLCRAKLL